MAKRIYHAHYSLAIGIVHADIHILKYQHAKIQPNFILSIHALDCSKFNVLTLRLLFSP